MRTKNNFEAIQELMACYTPAQMGVVSPQETILIRDVLELSGRNRLELQDIRDASVMIYGKAAEQAGSDAHKISELMDAMSAVTAVIDQEEANREVPGCAVEAWPETPMYGVVSNDGTLFLTGSASKPFKPDPWLARKWESPSDAATMAGYAASHMQMPGARVARLEPVLTVFPISNQEATKKGV